MTYPAEQPPTVPGPPNQYWPPQPQAYGPPVKPPNPYLAFWTSAAGIISMLAIAGAVALGIVLATDLASGPASKNFTVGVTSCEATSGSTAKVGLRIKNTSSTARSATVKIEYRDSAGNRLDTDSVYVRTLQPGDSASVTESTLLDGAPSGTIRCAITGIS